MKKKLHICALIIGFFSQALMAQTSPDPDPFLAQAFDGVWQMERVATTLLTERVDTRAINQMLRHEPQYKDAPIYLRETGEVGAIEYQKKRYAINPNRWGSFPHLNADTMRLIEIKVPQTSYLVLSGLGEGLFSATTWKHYRFLHVLDIGRGRNIVNYYPLLAEAGLGERVLGHLPDSPSLNYARLVPTTWDKDNLPIRYEILLYSLDRNGIERVFKNGIALSYILEKATDSPLWNLSKSETTPITDELDRKGHYFTGARMTIEDYERLHPPKNKKRSKKKNTKKKDTTK